MIDFEFMDMSDTIDQDFTDQTQTFDSQNFQHEVPMLDVNSFSKQDIFMHKDPLQLAHRYEFQPLHLNMDQYHFVEPHDVQGYTKKDGTYVEGYYRDGDGDTSINRAAEQGGGYFRGNPDGIKHNNLKP